MRAVALLLVALDLFLAFRLSRMAEAREELLGERAALEQGAAALEATRAEAVRFERLLESYLERSEQARSSEELGVAGLRDELLAAEQGLELDRLSLEFRPEPELVEGMPGSRVQANLRGSFAELYEFLARLESKRLPLAPAELIFRDGGEGDVTLTVRWIATWPPRGGSPALSSLSAGEVERLSRWLGREVPAGGGALFAGRASRTASALPPAPELLPPPADPGAPDASESEPTGPHWPALVGFVLARPELEPDVDRRVLAALRHDGELHLAKVGDALGGFRVEAIDGRESVTLSETSTGERALLRLP